MKRSSCDNSDNTEYLTNNKKPKIHEDKDEIIFRKNDGEKLWSPKTSPKPKYGSVLVYYIQSTSIEHNGEFMVQYLIPIEKMTDEWWDKLTALHGFTFVEYEPLQYFNEEETKRLKSAWKVNSKGELKDDYDEEDDEDENIPSSLTHDVKKINTRRLFNDPEFKKFKINVSERAPVDMKDISSVIVTTCLMDHC